VGAAWVIEKPVAVRFRIAQPNDAFIQEHQAFLFVSFGFGLQAIELNHWSSPFAPERVIHKRVTIQG
jgi:hypothetical protein